MKFKVRKNFPSKISDKEEMEKAIKDFGLNYCKASSYLKKDPDLALEAVKSDPYSVMFMNDDVITPEIEEAIKERKPNLEKYINPLATVIDFTKPLTEYDIKLIDGEKIINKDIKQNQFTNNLRQLGDMGIDFGSER